MCVGGGGYINSDKKRKMDVSVWLLSKKTVGCCRISKSTSTTQIKVWVTKRKVWVTFILNQFKVNGVGYFISKSI